jgi:uncharacterized membrane protein YidH (DUF202 family)
MAIKNSYRGNPIDPITAKITMISFGLVLLAIGFFVSDLIIVLEKQAITHLVIGTILIVSSIIMFIELGFKRFSDWSRLKKFENQQLISFIIAVLVLVSGILNFFGLGYLIDFFNAGSIVTSGAFIILEALR